MILDDMQKSRQLMLKNSGAPRPSGGARDPNAATADLRALGMITALETANHPVTWVANNSNYNNPILPVFPRFDDEPPKKDEAASSSS